MKGGRSSLKNLIKGHFVFSMYFVWIQFLGFLGGLLVAISYFHGVWRDGMDIGVFDVF